MKAQGSGMPCAITANDMPPMQAVAIINFGLKPDLCEPGMLTGKGAALREKAKESRFASAAAADVSSS